jgi:branched-chain amino acid transport system permease protein
MKMQESNTINWRSLVQTALLFGLATVYVSLIGMVEGFSERDVIRNFFTLGLLLVSLSPILAGQYLMNQKIVPANPQAFVGGAAAGVLLSLAPLVLVFLSLQTNIREMFVNASPNLVNILLFNFYESSGWVVGGLVFTLFNVILTAVSAGYTLIPDKIRQTLTGAWGLTIFVGLFGELFSQILQPFLGNFVRQIFISGALTIPGTIFFLLLGAFWGYFNQDIRGRYQAWSAGLAPAEAQTYQKASNGALFIFLLLLPWLVGAFLSEVLNNVGLYIMMALGLNIAVGMAGLLDLGYLTNYAVGAYVMAVLTATPPAGSDLPSYGLPFWVVLPLCILAAMFTGFVFALPVLRMRGDYLAIATLGFGEIIRVLAISDWLKPFLGGAQGTLYIPVPSLFGLEETITGFRFNDPRMLYYIILAGCAVVLYVVWRLNYSRQGRQWMAIREDEDVAEAMGINLVRTKVWAFTLSAAAGGLAGGIFAAKVGSVFPQSFTALISINVLSVIIVGGMGSIPGIIVGALVLVGMPEILREFDEYRQLIYGVLLIWMMLQRPEGLIPSAVRQRELHAHDQMEVA